MISAISLRIHLAESIGFFSEGNSLTGMQVVATVADVANFGLSQVQV
jgi:hypothetical protein